MVIHEHTYAGLGQMHNTHHEIFTKQLSVLLAFEMSYYWCCLYVTMSWEGAGARKAFGENLKVEQPPTGGKASNMWNISTKCQGYTHEYFSFLSVGTTAAIVKLLRIAMSRQITFTVVPRHQMASFMQHYALACSQVYNISHHLTRWEQVLCRPRNLSKNKLSWQSKINFCTTVLVHISRHKL